MAVIGDKKFNNESFISMIKDMRFLPINSELYKLKNYLCKT